MDTPTDRKDVALAHSCGAGTRLPPAREPTCAEVAAAALRDALAGRRAARRERHAAKVEAHGPVVAGLASSSAS